MDSEFADDTMLYIHFVADVLDTLRGLLDTLCGRINWAKSLGILVGIEEDVSWGLDVGFTWLQSGQSCRSRFSDRP